MKTIKETAILFNVSEMTVRRWIKDGRLTSVKVGKRAVRIEEEGIEKIRKGEN